MINWFILFAIIGAVVWITLISVGMFFVTVWTCDLIAELWERRNEQ